MLSVYQKVFIQSALDVDALKFGDFTLKSGRQSPYFFNAGAFNHGAALSALAASYAEVIWQMRGDGHQIDLLFGPAYKGIPLIAAIAVVLAKDYQWSVPWAFNRKEMKDHGEGGMLVGAPVTNQKVLLIDDVLTAGTAIKQSLALLKQEGAKPFGVLVALDRMEKVSDSGSALDNLREQENIYADAVINLDELLSFMASSEQLAPHLDRMRAYRKQYGV